MWLKFFYEKYQVWTIYDPSMPYLITTTKSTCGCKDDKDECDTETNPVWDRAALQCFHQIIWFALEKFNLYFHHFESFELPSPEGQGPLKEAGALLFLESSVWPPLPQGLDPLWAVGASLASSFKALLSPFSRTTGRLLRIAQNSTFFARMGSRCQKDWPSLLF